MEYSIVIPTYNESDKISSSLTQVIQFMKQFSSSYEVIVVDDGSKDNTAEIVKTYSQDNPEVRVIENPHKGKAFAVLTGMLISSGQYVYMADADFSAPINEIKKLSVWIKDQGFDIVIGSREGAGAVRIGEPILRHVMGRVFNTFVRSIILPGIKDSQCGFKLFTNKAAKDVFSRLVVYGKDTKEIDKPFTGAWDVEVLYIARKLGYNIKEVPVVWTFVRTTRISPIVDSIKFIRDVLKIKFNDIKGIYNKDLPTTSINP